jgi:hypothetical protein
VGDGSGAGLLTISGSYTQADSGVPGVAPGGTVSLTGAFPNFTGTTLTGGTYRIGGTFRFTGAHVVTNAATVVLDGPAAQVVDEMGNDGLAALAVNDGAGSLLLAGGASLTTAGNFSNHGFLSVGWASRPPAPATLRHPDGTNRTAQEGPGAAGKGTEPGAAGRPGLPDRLKKGRVPADIRRQEKTRPRRGGHDALRLPTGPAGGAGPRRRRPCGGRRRPAGQRRL